ncbi:MAG: extracellular solute-binding protein, partial [Mesorhizobium sp.]
MTINPDISNPTTRKPLSVLKSHLHAACAATALLLATGSLAQAADLNALIWCDHADPALLQPFEEANGVKVNVKEFEGTGAGIAIVEQSQPGDWDVMVIDSIDIPRGVEKGLFEPLPEDKLPLADLFPLPVIGMAALAIGKKTVELTEADLPAIKEELLKMKANAKLVGEVTASQTALATGEVDILVGGGEWVTAGLAKENPALDFSIPREGAVLWSQSLAMFKDSKNKDTALKFIQYIM